MTKKIRVAVVCGGASSERNISLKTGQQVAKALTKDKYSVSFIEILPDNHWVRKNKLTNQGVPVLNFWELKKKIDVAFLALHGKFGEDGRVQAVFDLLGVPYTGSGVLASALGMSKLKCSEFVAASGILTPGYLRVRRGDAVAGILSSVTKKIGYPCVVKPNESGSSIGVSIVKNSSELKKALRSAFLEGELVMIEKYISGRELTCGVMGNNGDQLKALPPVEIIAAGSQFFDYQAKYSSEKTQEVCPAKIGLKITKEIQSLAKQVHEIVGCDGLTRSDFILSNKNQRLYFLEINTIPGQTEASICPKEAKALGIPFNEFISSQVQMALRKKRLN